MNNTDFINQLEEKAHFLRKQLCILSNEEQIDHIHLGGLLSSVDILTALYYGYMNIDLNNLEAPQRCKFIPSKPHCAVLLYLIFADMGIYEYDEIFSRYKQLGHMFYQVPIREIKGIEVSTGSLGHGLSVATGMAIANRADNITSRIYCLTGDGEMQEGSNWEAIMYAGSHKLSNIVCILDDNRCTASFRYGDNITLDSQKAFEAFGWETKVIDGSNMEEIVQAFESMPDVDFSKERKPIAIIARTTKGEGVDFIQGPGWHYGCLSNRDLDKAIKCIEKKHEESYE